MSIVEKNLQGTNIASSKNNNVHKLEIFVQFINQSRSPQSMRYAHFLIPKNFSANIIITRITPDSCYTPGSITIGRSLSIVECNSLS